MLPEKAEEYRRIMAVKWVNQGMTQQEAAKRLEVTQGAVSQWVARARQGGEEALKTQPRSGRPTSLSDETMSQVLTALEALGPDGFGYKDQRWTIQRIADSVDRLTGVRYSQTHMGRLLKRWGWSWQKPRRQDIRRDEAAIEHWRDVIWPELKKTGPGTGRNPDLRG